MACCIQHGAFFCAYNMTRVTRQQAPHRACAGAHWAVGREYEEHYLHNSECALAPTASPARRVPAPTWPSPGADVAGAHLAAGGLELGEEGRAGGRRLQKQLARPAAQRNKSRPVGVGREVKQRRQELECHSDKRYTSLWLRSSLLLTKLLHGTLGIRCD